MDDDRGMAPPQKPDAPVEELLRRHYRGLQPPAARGRSWVAAARLQEPRGADSKPERRAQWVWGAAALAWSLLLLMVPRPWPAGHAGTTAGAVSARIFVPGIGPRALTPGAMALAAPIFVRRGKERLAIWGVYADGKSTTVAAAWSPSRSPLLLDGMSSYGGTFTITGSTGSSSLAINRSATGSQTFHITDAGLAVQALYELSFTPLDPYFRRRVSIRVGSEYVLASLVPVQSLSRRLFMASHQHQGVTEVALLDSARPGSVLYLAAPASDRSPGCPSFLDVHIRRADGRAVRVPPAAHLLCEQGKTYHLHPQLPRAGRWTVTARAVELGTVAGALSVRLPRKGSLTPDITVHWAHGVTVVVRRVTRLAHGRIRIALGFVGGKRIAGNLATVRVDGHKAPVQVYWNGADAMTAMVVTVPPAERSVRIRVRSAMVVGPWRWVLHIHRAG
jgi:hypothetical protein